MRGERLRSWRLGAALATLASAALAATAGHAQPPFALRSAAFADGTAMPARLTCDGANRSPPLAWSAPPPGTRSLALVVDDPDAPDPAAPRVTWVHWIVLDLPPEAGALPEAVGADALPGDARFGVNDWKRADYGGPCPPVGRHRYFFKLLALDVALGGRGPLSKAELESAAAGHVLRQVELVGTYRRGD